MQEGIKLIRDDVFSNQDAIAIPKRVTVVVPVELLDRAQRAVEFMAEHGFDEVKDKFAFKEYSLEAEADDESDEEDGYEPEVSIYGCHAIVMNDGDIRAYFAFSNSDDAFWCDLGNLRALEYQFGRQLATKAGYQVHQGDESDEDLNGKWWWTLDCPGGVQASDDFDSEESAWNDAIQRYRYETAVAKAGDDTPVGVAGRLVTVTGETIVGICERVSGTGGIVAAWRNEDGSLTVERSDQLELAMASREPVTNHEGERLFVTSSKAIVPERDVQVAENEICLA